MTRAFIGLGGNQGDSHQLFDRALDRLGNLPQSVLMRCSPRYRTQPLGDPDQPDFLNAVAEVETSLAPLALLRGLRQIEDALGRTRDPERRWGPRTIDLDLLLFGHAVVRTPDLVVPHPRIANRGFVLGPLADLAPRLEIPSMGRVCDLLAGVDTSSLRRTDCGIDDKRSDTEASR